MRKTPYLKKPDDQWVALKADLDRTTLFLVARSGPTVFQIKDEAGNCFKTIIGNPNVCSCGPKNMCIHILYCLMKVLRIPESHPSCFQTSLTDGEVEQMLRGLDNEDGGRHRNSSSAAARRAAAEKEANTSSTNAGKEGEGGFVNRQPLDDDTENCCPICQDDLQKDQKLTWCRKGCGNNIHAKCMQTFAQFNISNRKDVSCPLCRADWVLEFLREDCRGKSTLKHSCSPAYCQSCSLTIRNTMYRCIECSQSNAFNETQGASRKPVDFCGMCFQSLSKEHNLHSFLSSNANAATCDQVEWTVCRNPRAPPHSIHPDVLASLQGRELTMEDYDILLGLDQQSNPTLPICISRALPKLNPKFNSLSNPLALDQRTQPVISEQCWCGHAYNDLLENASTSVLHQTNSSTTSKILRILPCGHVGHEKCIVEQIDSAIAEEDTGVLGSIRCPHTDCNQRIFKGLSRKRKSKPKPVANANNAADVKPTDQNSINNSSNNNNGNSGGGNIERGAVFGHGVLGLGIQGSGIDTDLSRGVGTYINSSSNNGGGGTLLSGSRSLLLADGGGSRRNSAAAINLGVGNSSSSNSSGGVDGSIVVSRRAGGGANLRLRAGGTGGAMASLETGSPGIDFEVRGQPSLASSSAINSNSNSNNSNRNSNNSNRNSNIIRDVHNNESQSNQALSIGAGVSMGTNMGTGSSIGMGRSLSSESSSRRVPNSRISKTDHLNFLIRQMKASTSILSTQSIPSGGSGGSSGGSMTPTTAASAVAVDTTRMLLERSAARLNSNALALGSHTSNELNLTISSYLDPSGLLGGTNNSNSNNNNINNNSNNNNNNNNRNSSAPPNSVGIDTISSTTTTTAAAIILRRSPITTPNTALSSLTQGGGFDNEDNSGPSGLASTIYQVHNGRAKQRGAQQQQPNAHLPPLPGVPRHQRKLIVNSASTSSAIIVSSSTSARSRGGISSAPSGEDLSFTVGGVAIDSINSSSNTNNNNNNSSNLVVGLPDSASLLRVSSNKPPPPVPGKRVGLGKLAKSIVGSKQSHVLDSQGLLEL